MDSLSKPLLHDHLTQPEYPSSYVNRDDDNLLAKNDKVSDHKIENDSYYSGPSNTNDDCFTTDC